MRARNKYGVAARDVNLRRRGRGQNGRPVDDLACVERRAIVGARRAVLHAGNKQRGPSKAGEDTIISNTSVAVALYKCSIIERLLEMLGARFLADRVQLDIVRVVIAQRSPHSHVAVPI